jgi:tetratricopeptide (TPR) repeat protein
VALHLPTLGFGFTGWDDTGYVPDNPRITSGERFAEIWTSAESEVYYPLMYTSFWLEYRLWGPSPAGYHATNVLLHGIDAVLVVLLLSTLGAPLPGAALGGALFAVHPLQVMTVAWIAERKNLLALLFTLLTLLAWSRGRRGLALLAFLAALLSKTVVLGLPLALLLFDALERPGADARLLWAAPMLAASALAAWLTVFFEHPFVGSGDSVLLPGFPSGCRSPVLPLGVPREAAAAGGAVSGLPALARGRGAGSLVAAAPGLDRGGGGLGSPAPRLRSDAARRIGWLLAVAAVLLFPSLGLISFANLALTFVSDHFLYLPRRHSWARRLDAGRGSPARGASRRPPGLRRLHPRDARLPATFRDGLSLWTRVVERAPDSYAGNLGLAEALARAGRLDEAEASYARALALEPRAVDGYLLAGRFRQEHGDCASAVPLYEKALALDAGKVPAILGLAACSAATGCPEEALSLYTRAVHLAPRDLAARMGLGATYLGFARPRRRFRSSRPPIGSRPPSAA